MNANLEDNKWNWSTFRQHRDEPFFWLKEVNTMNKMLFLAFAIAIAAVAGVMGLTVTQEAEAHCDGVGNCNGIQGSGERGQR